MADGPSHRVWAVDPDGEVTPFAGDGTPCETQPSDDPDWDPLDQCGQGDPATTAQLLNPWGLAVAGNGDVYIADRDLGCVRRVRAGILETVGGLCDSGDGGPSEGLTGRQDKNLVGDGQPSSEFNLGLITDVAVRDDGAFFVASQDGVRFVGTDGILSTVVNVATGGGGGGGGGGGEPGFAPKGDLPPPDIEPAAVDSLSLGPNGTLYLSDPVSHRLFALSVDSELTVIAGTGSEGIAADGTPATEAELSAPTGLHVNTDGRLYVAETGNRWLRRLDTDGALYTTTGDGNAGIPVEGEPALDASYGTLSAVTQSPDGDVYVLAGGTIWRVGLTLDGYAEGEVPVPAPGGGVVDVFDSRGRHLRTVHGLTGAVLYTFDYDDQGRVISLTDADGLITTVTRDESTGDATAIVGPFGQNTGLFTDEQGYLERITNPAGESYRFEYVFGLMTRFEDPRFEDEGYGEDEAKTYEFDGRGRLVRAEDSEDGFTTLRRQGEAGQPDYEVRHKTKRSVTTRYRQRRTRTGETIKERVHPDGTSTETVRYRNGVSVTTLPSGAVLTQAQDPDPRLGMMAGFAGTGRLDRPSGRTGRTSATRSVNLTNADDPFSVDQLTHTYTIEGRTTSLGYDGTTRRFTATSPEARSRTMDIDARGRIASASAPQLEPLAVVYLDTGELDTVTIGTDEATRRRTTFAYDDFHRVGSITDAEGFTVGYGYDAANRIDTITLPDLNTVSLGYDAMGNVTTVSPPGRPAHGFTYTKRNQLETYTLPDVGAGPSMELRVYDDDRRLERIVRADGREIAFDYETLKNRLESLKTPRGDLLFTYQDDGKLDTVTTFDGQTLDYAYDGPVLTETTWTGTIAGSVGRSYDNSLRLTALAVNGDPVVYTYDDDSLLLTVGALSIAREPDTGRIDTVALGQITTEWSYTDFGEPETLTTKFGPSVIYEETFTYDKRGWITDLVRTQGGATVAESFAYDDRGRLETVHYGGTLVSTYGYDANSNRTSYDGTFGTVTTTSYDDRDRLLHYGDTSYTYTDAGELVLKSVGEHTVTYDYDVLGNLRQVVLDSGTTIDYIIDGAQRRIGKKVDGKLVKGWIYQDGLNPIAELDGVGNVVSRFVYGTRANVPDYMVKDGIIYRIVADHLGSPRLVVDSSTGLVVQELRYDEFGRITLDTNPGFQPFGFAGGLYDHQTGLVRFGARDYDPEVGRWTAADPIGFGGGLNLYRYSYQNPLNFIDPAGDIPFLVGAALVWGGIEIGLSLWDAYETGKTLLDPCASLGDKVSSGGGFMLGMIGPGGGYGTGAKAIGRRLPQAGGGAKLENLSAAEMTRIQNAANRTGQEIHVVGSRAKGLPGPESDWDYVVPGANSKTRHSLSSSLPEGPRLGVDSSRNQDFMPGPLDPSLPHISFFPER